MDIGGDFQLVTSAFSLSVDVRSEILALMCLRWLRYCLFVYFFFFQAEDGIRDLTVTGVQTCALPISPGGRISASVASWKNRNVVRGVCSAGFSTCVLPAASAGENFQTAIISG